MQQNIQTDIETLKSEILRGMEFQSGLNKFAVKFLTLAQEVNEQYRKCFDTLNDYYGDVVPTPARIALMSAGLFPLLGNDALSKVLAEALATGKYIF